MTAALAFLLIALAVGVPIRGHAHHEGDHRHVGSPEHAHGLELIQFEMRLERAVAPLVAVAETPITTSPPPAPLRVVELPDRDEGFVESRAPPTPGPRAPPA